MSAPRAGFRDAALGFLDDLERWIAVDTSRASAALRAALLQRLREAQAAEPTQALVHQFAARALDVADAAAAREDSVVDMRTHLARSCAAEREDLAAARAQVARTALELLGADGWVATLSHSEIVREALIEAHRTGRKPRVLAAESRPRYEGRELAAALAALGIPVWLVADAALPLLLSQARMLWLGAAAVTDRGVITKVGSYALALAAREHSVPVYVLAEKRKFMPAVTRALQIAEMPPDEIWKDAPDGVQPRNVYFELVPLELTRGIVVEDAVVGAAETAVMALERPLPEELLPATGDG